MSIFIIKRPIFAWVLAIIVMLAGIIAIIKLPMEQYPDVPSTAIQIIEQNMTGLDGLIYMSSTSDS